MKKKIIILTMILGVMLTGCTKSKLVATLPETAEQYPIIENQDLSTQENGISTETSTNESDTFIITKTDIAENPTFINYDAGETYIQLIAVKNSSGKYKVSLNTCQSCSPSPMSYFAVEENNLVCQNCRNSFSFDTVGEQVGGCNPMYIPYTETKDTIEIKTDDLKEHISIFKNWAGPIL